jgi:hypothetical protein
MTLVGASLTSFHHHRRDTLVNALRMVVASWISDSRLCTFSLPQETVRIGGKGTRQIGRVKNSLPAERIPATQKPFFVNGFVLQEENGVLSLYQC